MPKNLTALLAVPLVTITLITGCSALALNTAESPKQSRKAEPTPAPEETQIPEEITGEPGDPLTAAEAKQLNGQRGTLRPYEKSDGSYVIIDVKQPLPPAVKEEVVQEMGSVPNDVGSVTQSMIDQATATGKTIVVVRQVQTSNDAGQNITTWAAGSYAKGFPIGIQGGSAEAVLAQVQPWVDAQNDPYLEVVVVHN
ncbi:hypothetical protein Q9R19_09235 [Microbacterium sp. ARD32]|uniref:hypothetical protein n=1 Tax=Microbacterium sp. ARD32 TaxID=2962577 RepID=UPI002882939D|nr:hypothetical protein [Microbacterium sp. ARD32]MDT0157806.1 hypothetical protein [Microbacterium sp. ARD32]